MQTNFNPKKRNRRAPQSQLCVQNQLPLRKQETHQVIEEDYVKDVLKLPQLSIWFKAAEAEICFTQAVAIWEVRLTRLGSFTYFLMADSPSNIVTHSWHGCISLRAPVSSAPDHPNRKTLGLWQHLIEYQAYYSQTCPLFCMYSPVFLWPKTSC